MTDPTQVEANLKERDFNKGNELSPIIYCTGLNGILSTSDLVDPGGYIGGEIITDEGVFSNTPHTRKLIAIADKIKSTLEQPAEGYVRLWRGSRLNEVGTNPSYTNSLAGIALPFLLNYKGCLTYIDVLKIESEKYLPTSGAARGSEFILPNKYLEAVKVVGLSKADTDELIRNSKQYIPESDRQWSITV